MARSVKGTTSLGPLEVRLEEVEVREVFEGPNLGRGRREMDISRVWGHLCAPSKMSLCSYKGLIQCEL